MSTQATQPSGGSAQTIFSAPFAAGFAFNEVTNNDASYYCSKNGVKAGWLQYDFASPQQVKTYKIEQINGASTRPNRVPLFRSSTRILG